MADSHPKHKLEIIGGGIAGAMNAYFAYLNAKENGVSLRVTIDERHSSVKDTTVSNIPPSLMPNEILSLEPGKKGFLKKVETPLSEGGFRVSDVPEIESSAATKRFKSEVETFSQDTSIHPGRTQTLLELGKMSMGLWQNIYNTADAELRAIFEKSNFHPARESISSERTLHDGYKISLTYNMPVGAAEAAAEDVNDYIKMGYKNSAILTPSDVKKIDPSLSDFCAKNSKNGTWNDDTTATWVPGGGIDTQVFLPLFYEYLRKKMGTYETLDKNGKIVSKDCFRIKYDREVTGALISEDAISALKFADRIKHNKHQYERSDYVFCPGEAVGTLQKFGFKEPAAAAFAGATLMLNIPIPAEKLVEFAGFNHFMEVFNKGEGVGLSWQARLKEDGTIFIGVGGTKAFYGDQVPHKDQEFCTKRNLDQLNIINDLLPACISIALGRDTKDAKLSVDDLTALEQKGVAKRWVGTRAVAFDGSPTIGDLYIGDKPLSNARTVTHGGCGGLSFSTGVAKILQIQKADPDYKFAQLVLAQCSSNRSAVHSP